MSAGPVVWHFFRPSGSVYLLTGENPLVHPCMMTMSTMVNYRIYSYNCVNCSLPCLTVVQCMQHLQQHAALIMTCNCSTRHTDKKLLNLLNILFERMQFILKMLNACGTWWRSTLSNMGTLNQDQVLSPIYIHLWLWSFKLNISQISASP